MSKSLFSKAMVYKFFREFLATLGVLALLLGVLAVAYPAELAVGQDLVLTVLGVSVAVALLRAWPRRKVTIAFAHPETTITIKVGDLFDEKSHLVIGFSDTFDTELGDLISADSVQGQFLSRQYRGNTEKLDQDLAAALGSRSFVLDDKKAKGKQKRYPAGTTSTLSGEGRLFVCSAYSTLRPDTYMAESNIDQIWLSLGNIWEELRVKGEQRPVAMPVVGSHLARVGGSTCATLIRLILLSYFVHSRVTPISRHFTLVIAEKDLDRVNLVDIAEFARNLHC